MNMYIFRSKYEHPILVVKTHKTDRDGNNLQEPVYIKFEEKLYRTDDEELANFIRRARNFNAEYFEITEDSIPQNAGYQGHGIGITKMDSKPENNPRMDQLEAQISALTGLVSQLAQTLTAKPSEAPKEKLEDNGVKLDKRSKEYKQSLEKE